MRVRKLWIILSIINLAWISLLIQCQADLASYAHFTLDNPLVPETPNGTIDTDTPTFTWQVLELPEHFLKYVIFVNDKEVGQTSETHYTMVTNLDDFQLDHAWHVEGWTHLRSFVSSSQTFQLEDHYAPTIEITGPSPALEYPDSLTVTGIISDNNTIALAEIRLNEGVWEPLSLNENQHFSHTFTFVSKDVDQLLIEVRATDTADNESDVVSAMFLPDHTAPSIAFTFPEAGVEPDVDTSVDITGTITDNNTVTEAWIRIQEGAWEALSELEPFVYTMDLTQHDLGQILIEIKALDQSGNETIEQGSVYNTYFYDDFTEDSLSPFWNVQHFDGNGTVKISNGSLIVKSDSEDNPFSDADTCTLVYHPVPDRDFTYTVYIKLVSNWKFSTVFGGYIDPTNPSSERYVFMSSMDFSTWGIGFRNAEGFVAGWDTGATRKTLMQNYQIRLIRQDSIYRFYYSLDGEDFYSCPGISNPFSPSEQLTAVGIVAGANYPGVQYVIDWMEITVP